MRSIKLKCSNNRCNRRAANDYKNIKGTGVNFCKKHGKAYREAIEVLHNIVMQGDTETHAEIEAIEIETLNRIKEAGVLIKY